jgi:hypothetical protein
MNYSNWTLSLWYPQRFNSSAGGANLVARHHARATSYSGRLSAASADSDALRHRAAGSTNAAASTRNKIKLFAGQLNGCVRINFMGALLDLYRLHVSHLKKITDQFVRKCSMPTLWGGGVKPLLPFGSQGTL